MTADSGAAPAEIREVAVMGLGTMGAGIAEVLARSGRSVVAVEANHTCLARGLAMLHASLDKTVARGRFSHAGKAEIIGRIRAADSIATGVAGADLVIEAVPERMDLKRAIVAELDHVCPPGAILATNTSSLSVTALAAAARRPGRVAGLHFFNPAPVMKLVEVVATVLTTPGTSCSGTPASSRVDRDVRRGHQLLCRQPPVLLPWHNPAVIVPQAATPARPKCPDQQGRQSLRGRRLAG